MVLGSVKSSSDLDTCKKSSDKGVLLSLRVIGKPVNSRVTKLIHPEQNALIF